MGSKYLRELQVFRSKYLLQQLQALAQAPTVVQVSKTLQQLQALAQAPTVVQVSKTGVCLWTGCCNEEEGGTEERLESSRSCKSIV
jgi:hypothetical protein